MGKKKKNKRPKASAGAPSRKKPPHPAGTGKSPARSAMRGADLVPALVDAKVSLLRLVRALDAAGVSPEVYEDLPEAVVHISQIDGLLLSLLELVHREPVGPEDDVPREFVALIETAELASTELRKQLPERLAAKVAEELPRVGASEAEIWLEVDGYRKAARKARREAKKGGHVPEEERDGADFQRAHDEALAVLRSGVQEDVVSDKVKRQEARRLPGDGDELDVWLQTLPKPWLLTIARMHDLDPKGSAIELAMNIADAIEDPGALAQVLAERVGVRERRRLVELAVAEALPLSLLPPEVCEGLQVPWDWRMALPATIGGKLRALGLLYVGRRDGETVASVPEVVRFVLPEALQMAVPQEWAELPAELRGLLEESVSLFGDEDDEDEEDAWDWEEEEDEDEDDALDEARQEAVLAWFDAHPGLSAWRDRAEELSIVLVEQLGEEDVPDEALDVFFRPLIGGRPPTKREADFATVYLMHDWRPEPGAPTLAERMLAEHPWRDEGERQLLASLCGQQASLYRVESVDEPRGVVVRDAFRPGESIAVEGADYASALHVGMLVPARILVGGPFRQFELVGDPVPEFMADPVLAALEARFAAFARERGTSDRDAFLAEVPESVAHAALFVEALAAPDGPPRLRLLEDASEPMPLPGGASKPSGPSNASRSARPEKIYVLDVSLAGCPWPIERRLHVSGSRSLAELHEILQIAMGWGDEHLHSFEATDGRWRYAPAHLEAAADEEAVTLAEVAPRKGSRFLYEYDFGDCWRHEIRVAERLAPKDVAEEPLCVDGANACPPEDSGGMGGYVRMLEILDDPDHEEFGLMRRWMRADFDRSAFDRDAVNARLRAAAR